MATLVSSQTYIYRCNTGKRALNQAKEPYSHHRFSRHNHRERRDFGSKNHRLSTLTITRKQQPLSFNTVCFAADEPSSSSSEIR